MIINTNDMENEKIKCSNDFFFKEIFQFVCKGYADEMITSINNQLKNIFNL